MLMKPILGRTSACVHYHPRSRFWKTGNWDFKVMNVLGKNTEIACGQKKAYRMCEYITKIQIH